MDNRDKRQPEPDRGPWPDKFRRSDLRLVASAANRSFPLSPFTRRFTVARTVQSLRAADPATNARTTLAAANTVVAMERCNIAARAVELRAPDDGDLTVRDVLREAEVIDAEFDVVEQERQLRQLVRFDPDAPQAAEGSAGSMHSGPESTAPIQHDDFA